MSATVSGARGRTIRCLSPGTIRPRPKGPFSWGRLPHVQAEGWIRKDLDLFVGSHDGYNRLPNAVVHRRYVFSRSSPVCGLCGIKLSGMEIINSICFGILDPS